MMVWVDLHMHVDLNKFGIITQNQETQDFILS